MSKPGFELYHSDIEALSTLSDAQLGKLIRLLNEYSATGNMPKLPPELVIPFSFLKQKIDLSAEHYKRICERNRKATEAREAKRKASKTKRSDAVPMVTSGDHSLPKAPHGANEMKRNEMKRKEIKYTPTALQYEQRSDPLDDLYTELGK